MLKIEEDKRKQIEFFCLEDLVPSEHLVRKIETIIIGIKTLINYFSCVIFNKKRTQ